MENRGKRKEMAAYMCLEWPFSGLMMCDTEWEEVGTWYYCQGAINDCY